MKRRKFLSSMALLLGAASVTPTVIFSEQAEVNKPIKHLKLKVRWTTEVADDLLALHGISMDDEIKNLLAAEINNELKDIDGTIISITEQKVIPENSYITYTEYVAEYI